MKERAPKKWLYREPLSGQRLLKLGVSVTHMYEVYETQPLLTLSVSVLATLVLVFLGVYWNFDNLFQRRRYSCERKAVQFHTVLLESNSLDEVCSVDLIESLRVCMDCP